MIWVVLFGALGLVGLVFVVAYSTVLRKRFDEFSHAARELGHQAIELQAMLESLQSRSRG